MSQPTPSCPSPPDSPSPPPAAESQDIQAPFSMSEEEDEESGKRCGLWASIIGNMITSEQETRAKKAQVTPIEASPITSFLSSHSFRELLSHRYNSCDILRFISTF
ncbi:hypothetical protein OCU04_011603 [Sclerotinia nivalis]|uniref:Uncharacterized protein n=1 Tax=Sclerotinia nivalis TaxID=352851 RepID=A0A9X0ABV8_9HELO|nr:hypothetical protein OCU04_011603 [Sclerotinia nivalis]